jgi:predicted dehydrogenase
LIIRRGTSPEDQPEVITFPEANQYAEQVTDFCTSIAQGRLLPLAEDGLANMRVLEAALSQAQAACVDSGGGQKPLS